MIHIQRVRVDRVIQTRSSNRHNAQEESCLKKKNAYLISPELLCCPWANIDSPGLTTTPFQLAPHLFRVSHSRNLGLDPNEQIHSGAMKFRKPPAAVPAHLGQELQLERAAIGDVGADVLGVGEHLMDGRPSPRGSRVLRECRRR